VLLFQLLLFALLLLLSALPLMLCCQDVALLFIRCPTLAGVGCALLLLTTPLFHVLLTASCSGSHPHQLLCPFHCFHVHFLLILAPLLCCSC
jgi:hypothetical protein